MLRSTTKALALLLACGLVAACSSAPALRDETRTEPYAGYLRQGAALHVRSAFVRAEDPGCPPLVMHLRHVRARGGARGPLVVLQPGVLADHKTFRYLWPLLAERHDLLLVDPPGTGRSDKPAVDTLPPDAYSPAWLGRHTLRAVRAWQCARGDTRRVAFVGHSLGSLALVRALAEPRACMEMADLCARVDALVLLAFPDVGMTEVAPVFTELEGLSGPLVRAGDAVGELGARTAEGVRASVVDPDARAFRQEAERLRAILVDDESREAAQWMLRRFRPLTREEQPDWPRIRAQQAENGNVRVPVLLLWGEADATLPPSMAQAALRQLPTARLEMVAGSMHSPHQERPRFCADRIARFLEERR